MKRKFDNIVCIYYTDKHHVLVSFNYPPIEFDDVILELTTDEESNYEKISKFIVDYAFALFCSKINAETEFTKDPQKFQQENWKLLDFKEIKENAPQKPLPSSRT